MKNILFFINSLNFGGAEKILIDLVNNLDITKYNITVQTVDGFGKLNCLLNSNIKQKSIYKIKNKLIKNILDHIIYKVLSPKFVYKHFIKDDYDIEIAFLEGFPTKIIANSTNKRSKKYAWVHTDFGKNFDSLKLFKNKNYYFEIYKKFDKILCVSNDVKNGFINRFCYELSSLCVVYNVIDDKKIIALSHENLEYIPKIHPVIYLVVDLALKKLLID